MSILKELMSHDLPGLTYQKKQQYITNIREVKSLYRLINSDIFNDKLTMPEIYVKPRLKKVWGQCTGVNAYPEEGKSACVIEIGKRWYCKQWLIMVLAHEMVHQWQWDIHGRTREKQGKEPIISHGPSFYKWKPKLRKHGIPLQVEPHHHKWFKTQHLFKC